MCCHGCEAHLLNSLDDGGKVVVLQNHTGQDTESSQYTSRQRAGLKSITREKIHSLFQIKPVIDICTANGKIFDVS